MASKRGPMLSLSTPEVLHPKLVGQGCPEPWGPTQKRKVAVRSFSDLRRNRRGEEELMIYIGRDEHRDIIKLRD